MNARIRVSIHDFPDEAGKHNAFRAIKCEVARADHSVAIQADYFIPAAKHRQTHWHGHIWNMAQEPRLRDVNDRICRRIVENALRGLNFR